MAGIRQRPPIIMSCLHGLTASGRHSMPRAPRSSKHLGCRSPVDIVGTNTYDRSQTCDSTATSANRAVALCHDPCCLMLLPLFPPAKILVASGEPSNH
jgi:hypothetical protein